MFAFREAPRRYADPPPVHINRIAEAAESRTARAVSAIWTRLSEEWGAQSDISHFLLEIAEAAVQWLQDRHDTISTEQFDQIARELAGTGTRAAHAAPDLASRAAVGMRWDIVDADMVAWAEAEAAQLVSQIDPVTRAGIRTAVGEAYRYGQTVGQTQKLIQGMIGLTDRDAAQVGRRIGDLITMGAKPEAAFRLGTDLADKLIKQRALVIARTETIDAANAGTMTAWDRMKEQGLLPPESQKTWIAAGDELMCPICSTLHGLVVPLDQPFQSDMTGPIMRPTAHPQCRCSMGLVFGEQFREPLAFAGPTQTPNGLAISTSDERAYDPARSTKLKTQMTSQERGALGERIVLAYLQQHRDVPSARALNGRAANFPLDILAGDRAFEVKAGPADNTGAARHWRSTIGEPSESEQAWLKTAAPGEKAVHNVRKTADILARKQQAVKALSDETGETVTGWTMALILDPDRKLADLYEFKGFHVRIGWDSPEAQKGYLGSFTYTVDAAQATEPWVFFSPGQRRDADGKWTKGAGGGGGHDTGITLRTSKDRAYDPKKPTPLKTQLTSQQHGALGERIVQQYLQQHHDLPDARPLNGKAPNFPIDVVADHRAIEVKTGLVDNVGSARQWRATIGQPGKAETAWLKTASAEDKAAHNEKKQKAIMARKRKAVRTISAETGEKVRGKTMTVIMDPDRKVADVYEFEGFHLRFGWNSPEAAKGYRGSFQYEDDDA